MGFLGQTKTHFALDLNAVVGVAAGMPYDGGKSQAGLWQWIVNRIPEHKTFVELFAGSAAIARLKLPCEKTVLIEKSVKQAGSLRAEFGARARVITGDGITMAQFFDDPDTVIYCDPPYVMSSRRGGRLYEHELEDEWHVVLLEAAKASKCKWIQSGYRSALYDAAGFSDRPTPPWNFETMQVTTRGRTKAQECLWYNFPRPTVVHDTRRVGENFRQRWRIEKRRRNWRKHFEAMPVMERASIFAVLAEVMASTSASSSAAAGVERSGNAE
jgi:DNA adenine methylase